MQTVRAAMLGHAVGDALGVPVEFSNRSDLQADPVTGYRGHGSHPVPAGTWSDDTAMALASLDSLTRGLDYEDMMRRFMAWWENAAYTATDVVFDMGIATQKALLNFHHGNEPLDCGLYGEYDNGNGSLMRIIPAALYCYDRLPGEPLHRWLEIIHEVSALTHAHLRSQMACGIYCCVLWALLDEPCPEAVRKGIDRAWDYYGNDPGFADEAVHYQPLHTLRELPAESIRSTGYVVDTLIAALWCLVTTASYSECVLKAVNLGSDTDTVAAVAGGLAGVLYGMEQIEPWLPGLIRHEEIDRLCEAFANA
ncbi:MAG: ADP-ribosylglycohydrolase family protein [Clostridia bacterium]|nr:ADP-ribosylglycohydrolase family protein [Clostridia bacterium]